MIPTDFYFTRDLCVFPVYIQFQFKYTIRALLQIIRTLEMRFSVSNATDVHSIPFRVDATLVRCTKQIYRV